MKGCPKSLRKTIISFLYLLVYLFSVPKKVNIYKKKNNNNLMSK